MKALILCLHIATVVAWPSGVYIYDGSRGAYDQYYNPLTEPHSQLNLDITFRGDKYRVAQNVCGEGRTCTVDHFQYSSDAFAQVACDLVRFCKRYQSLQYVRATCTARMSLL